MTQFLHCISLSTFPKLVVPSCLCENGLLSAAKRSYEFFGKNEGCGIIPIKENVTADFTKAAEIAKISV
jgi:hypothetical protein